MNSFNRDDTTPRARARWAASIERLLVELERPEPLMRGARRLYRRDVAAASAHSLIEIRWVLVDESARVRPEAMRRLREFLSDGAQSPLYGDSPEQARRTAREIAVAFVVPAAAHSTHRRAA
jgi:RecB family exonuclease